MMRNRRDDTTTTLAATPAAANSQPWQLCLYVAGPSDRATRALANLRGCCEQHLAGRYALEVVDVQAFPEVARREQLLALPALVQRGPGRRKCLVGDLSNPEQLLRSLTAEAA
ncbi:circadian clock protein KaiB [Hymenobacter sp. RP-2-7]|uniref:Circadian clock protein KaiB n=1 Tax=Hymenobacter polaris TaxID=2682546 RepID=A0A7Y0FKL4_9BACT|nr:circadian clock KaiB family protein [Hymenobacter polaris]NML63837.1 circadian clock protein KaiB [Hymenobacter polaris]